MLTYHVYKCIFSSCDQLFDYCYLLLTNGYLDQIYIRIFSKIDDISQK